MRSVSTLRVGADETLASFFQFELVDEYLHEKCLAYIKQFLDILLMLLR